MQSTSSALDRLRQQVGIGAHRGVVATVSAHIIEEEDDRASVDQMASGVLLRPGVLPQHGGSTTSASDVSAPEVVRDTGSGGSPLERLRAAARKSADETKGAVSGDVSAGALNGAEAVSNEGRLDAVRNVASPAGALGRLRALAQQEETEQQSAKAFRRNMAALRSLGRLMEAVYVRPGSRAEQRERIEALRALAQASRMLAQDLLRAIGESDDSAYVRAMAMDAVIDLVAHSWQEARDGVDPDASALRRAPLELIEQAAVDEDVLRAAQDLAHKTWNPVRTQDQYREALALAAHRTYWQFYMLGEHVDGMDEDRCRQMTLTLVRYLQDFPTPRGDTPETRANWMSASLGRLARLACAELRSRFGHDLDDGHDRGTLPTDKDVRDCLDAAIIGFEGVEEHASKLLEISSDAVSERLVERPGAV